VHPPFFSLLALSFLLFSKTERQFIFAAFAPSFPSLEGRGGGRVRVGVEMDLPCSIIFLALLRRVSP
jgi:hypothetical protein